MEPDLHKQLLRRIRQARNGDAGGEAAGRITAAVQEFVDVQRAALQALFAAAPSGATYAREHAGIFDHVLSALYQLAVERVTERLGTLPREARLCVAAVGGYGRASLSPWSDIDIVFIPAVEDNPAIDAIVREILQLLGDTLIPGRHPLVAHSYRPLGDLGLIDHQTATALLESRLLAGDAALHAQFMQRLMQSVEPVEFLHLNLAERRAIWESPDQSLFAVEPNLKQGPGALRDFHTAIWVSKVVYGIEDWDILWALRERGIVTAEDNTAVLAALEFLLLCRNWLHVAKGQKLDILHVEYQQPMALGLGYSAQGQTSAAELLMADLYGHARTLHRFARQLIDTAQRQPLSFRHGTEVVNWTLYAARPEIFAEDPARLLFVHEEQQRLALTVSTELARLMAENLPRLGPPERDRPAVASSFLRILSSDGDVATTLRAMLFSGVLEQVLPEFGPLMTFLPGDPAHDYTVGEHTLKVVEALQRLRDQPSDEDEQALSHAFESLREPAVLFLAALLHDLGKMDRGDDHSSSGAPVAEQLALRLGMQPGSAARVRFLVQQHLTMTRTARLRATSLPETIEKFIAVLPTDATLDALDMLMLLTVADASSVGHEVFRENERRQLMELFLKSVRWVQEQPLADEPSARERISRRLRSAPAFRDIDPERIRQHLAGMPTWYAVNTPPAVIAKHMGYLERVAEGEAVVIEYYHALQAMHTELIVCREVRPGLLRDIAAAVAANNLDIYLAQSDVCTLAGPAPKLVAITTIWVDDYGHPLGPIKKDRLRADLERLMTDSEVASAILTRHGKTVPEAVILHDISINNGDSRQHTVVNIRADNQKGLLFRLTDALAAEQLDITVAKVTTWRGAAEDAFYVRRLADQRKLTDAEAAELASRLRSRLAGQVPGEGA